MERPLVIYHANCLDGFGAACAVYLHFQTGDSCPCDFIPASHGQAPPDVGGRDVYVVDFSYRREVLKELCLVARSLTVIDHHVTADFDLAGLEMEHENLKVVYDREKSGAVLAWEYFSHSPVPKLLLYIQDRDLWRFELEGSNDICAALMARPFDFHSWTEFIVRYDAFAELIVEGKAINLYRRKMIDLHRDKAVMGTIAGHIVPVVNCYTEIASDLLDELALGHPFAAVYHDQGTIRKWSLRSSEAGVNVAKIAELFGGGGHRNSAGFITRLPESIMNFPQDR